MSGGSTDTGSSKQWNDVGADGLTDLPCLAWKEHPGWLQCRVFSKSMSCCSRHYFFSYLRLFSVYSACLLRTSTLCLMVLRQESRSWACSLQVSDRLHSLSSLDTMSFHLCFCPPALRLPPTGADTRSCLGSHSSGILERCPRKQRRR